MPVSLPASRRTLTATAAMIAVVVSGGVVAAGASGASVDAASSSICFNKKTGAAVHVITGTAKCASGEKSVAVGLTGPRGKTGATGATGAAGAVGATGLAGLIGPAGPAGTTGLQGLRGLIGATGPAGAAGATGPAGPTTVLSPVIKTVTQSVPALSAGTTVNAVCDAGKKAIGGGSNAAAGLNLLGTLPVVGSSDTWQVVVGNLSALPTTVTAYAVCI
jgi:hypothetical protein